MGYEKYFIYNVGGSDADDIQQGLARCGVAVNQRNVDTGGSYWIQGNVRWGQHNECLDGVLHAKYGNGVGRCRRTW